MLLKEHPEIMVNSTKNKTTEDTENDRENLCILSGSNILSFARSAATKQFMKFMLLKGIALFCFAEIAKDIIYIGEHKVGEN